MDLDQIHQFFLSKEFEIKLNKVELANWIREYSLNFLCPICKSVLNQTVGVKDCMHKFCITCIKDSINSRNRSCPLCMTKIRTVRDICRDYQFDTAKKEFYVFWYAETNKEEIECNEDVLLTLIPRPSSTIYKNVKVSTSSCASGTLNIFILSKHFYICSFIPVSHVKKYLNEEFAEDGHPKLYLNDKEIVEPYLTLKEISENNQLSLYYDF